MTLCWCRFSVIHILDPLEHGWIVVNLTKFSYCQMCSYIFITYQIDFSCYFLYPWDSLSLTPLSVTPTISRFDWTFNRCCRTNQLLHKSNITCPTWCLFFFLTSPTVLQMLRLFHLTTAVLHPQNIVLR